MFSNLRLCKAPRSPPDVRQPVSLFQRKITRAGCQKGGLGSPLPAAGEIISLIFQHLKPRIRQFQRGQIAKEGQGCPPFMAATQKSRGKVHGPGQELVFHVGIPFLPQEFLDKLIHEPFSSHRVKRPKMLAFL